MFFNHQFKAFDSEISLGIIIDSDNLKNISKKIELHAKKFEQKFSRFVSTSELNQINHKKTEDIKVSKEMLELLTKAQKAFQQTEGIFDPTILILLNEIGYNQTFDSLQEKSLSIAKIKQNFRTRVLLNNLKINKNKQTISVPLDFKIDLGGIAKGYWVDQVKQILDQYSHNYWLSAGGDVYLKGKQENGDFWKIGVQNPLDLNRDILNLNLPAKGIGIATSGIMKRQGKNDKYSWNHIIDPRKGTPVKNSILSVTVLANSTLEADVMAKTILILGIKKGITKINNLKNYECIIIDNKSKIHISKGIKIFL